MERSLLYHCRALLMDEADTLLEGAYVEFFFTFGQGVSA